MTACLLALGSNLGDRAATLDSAAAALEAMPDVSVVRRSSWQMTLPVGGTLRRREFLNGAMVVETTLEPEELLGRLQQIETSHGRVRHERWGDRTLDLDLLLFGDRVIDSPTLTLPHPRMSFRRFVLEPAAEIAGDMMHPTIGWTIAQLLDHLDAGADCVAILSAQESARREVAEWVTRNFAFTPREPSIADPKWPQSHTTWLRLQAASDGGPKTPKLSIVVDPANGRDGDWRSIADERGRGPTLRIRSVAAELVAEEVLAAIHSVWPHLGRAAS